MGRKSAENLLDGIQASKDRGLARLLKACRSATWASGWPGAGRAFRLDRRAAGGRRKELSEVNEIGPIIAESVHQFLHGKFGRKPSPT